MRKIRENEEKMKIRPRCAWLCGYIAHDSHLLLFYLFPFSPPLSHLNFPLLLGLGNSPRCRRQFPPASYHRQGLMRVLMLTHHPNPPPPSPLWATRSVSDRINLSILSFDRATSWQNRFHSMVDITPSAGKASITEINVARSELSSDGRPGPSFGMNSSSKKGMNSSGGIFLESKCSFQNATGFSGG